MKKLNIGLILSIILLNFFLINLANAQLTGGWFEQQSPSGNYSNDVKFFDESTGIIVGMNGMILKTTSGGSNWILLNSGTTKNLNSMSIIYPSTIYIAGDSGIILKSTDGGNAWQALTSQTISNLYSIVFRSTSSGFTAGSKGTLLKTTNSGVNWVSTFSDTSACFYSMSYINENFIWAIGQKSHPVYPVGIPIMINSTDFGLTWNDHNIEDFYFGTSIYYTDTLVGFAFNCSTPLNFGILKTTDGGLNWNCLGGLFFSPYNTYFVNQDTGYSVGEGSGNYSIYKTTNSGLSWYSSFVPYIYLFFKSAYFVNSQTGWAVGNKIFKTTNGGGLLTNLNMISDKVPSEFSLSQNYPNPFNPNTKIGFDISKTTFTRLTVYNSEGKKIESLVDENLKEGSYEITFDGSNYPTGVYYYKLETNEFTISKKMLLLK